MTAKMPEKAPAMRLNASCAHSPSPTPDTPLEGRICACGCETVFTAKRWWQTFVSTEHRKRKWNEGRRMLSRLADHEARIRALETNGTPEVICNIIQDAIHRGRINLGIAKKGDT